jgi:hypothetical protein
MSTEAHVRVTLHDGNDDGTWVTYMPIDQLDSIGAKIAAGRAFAFFVANLEKDGDVLTERLRANRRLVP